jgi:hypothetical protein
LRIISRSSGQSFRKVVNESLRRGLHLSSPPSRPFKMKVRDLGQLRAGLSLDDIGELIETVEGPLAR